MNNQRFYPYSIFLIFIGYAVCLHAEHLPYRLADPEIIKNIFHEPAQEFPSLFTEPSEKKMYDPKTWNEYRRYRETGAVLKTKTITDFSIEESTATVLTADQEKVKRAFDVDLAYESGLSIQGIKTIDVSFSQKKYKHESATDLTRKKQVNTFTMEQTLRVDIEGKVGRKINVNVHFDDTQDNKRELSVVYTGDPDEVVQEAAFGDITLSLPQTQYVNYNKQVFGIKADLKYKMLRFMAIGSRTKGETETKVYTGQTQRLSETIKDTSFQQRKYYKPFDLSSVIKRDTIKIWKDDQIATNNETTGAVSYTISPYNITISTRTYTGYFDEMKQGIDFSYDPITNVITFKNTVDASVVLAIDYDKQDNTTLSSSNGGGNKVILKDSANTEGITRELKNYYKLANTKIIRDNNRGNFVFQIQDTAKTIPASLEPGGKDIPSYPAQIEVDWDNGIIFFKQAADNYDELRPFPDNVYGSNTHLYDIFVEYHSRVKSYSLRPNIVPNSERIVVDGVALTRDVDYYILYEVGTLTFYNEDRITDTSRIEITYEYAPFGGQFGQTLVGSRLEISPLDHFFIGSSVLYNFSAKPLQVPDMQSQPDSTMVWGVDSRIEDISFGNFPFKINSVKGEFAQSIYNPNIYGKAIIESMEGLKEDDALSTNKDYWLRASRPLTLISGSSSLMRYDALSITNQDIKTSEIYLGIGTPLTDIWWEDEDEQQVMVVDYDLSKTAGDVASMAQVVSKSGNDYSEKLYLEVIFYDDGNGEKLTFELGSINEDADGDGFLESEDANNNGTLDKGEDIGWRYTYPGLADVLVEPENGRIDKEDLDGDGIFDAVDTIANSYTIDSQGYAGWRYESIELKIADSDINQWKSIKQIRMSISSQAGIKSSQGSIKIARIGVVGANRFKKPTITPSGTATMSAYPVNNQDNPGYVSLLNHPIFNELYPDSSNQKKEQALKLEYNNFTTAADGSVSIDLSSIDISKHKRLKFFMYNNDTNAKTVYVDFGTDSSYFEFIIDIGANAPQQWEVYEIIMEDLTGDDVADRMIYGNTAHAGEELSHPASTIPSLKSVSRLKIGIRNVEGSGSVLVNDFFVDTAVKQVGQAGTVSGAFEVPGWMNFGGNYQEKNRNFKTIAESITGQDSYSENGNLSLTRLKWMPMSVTASKSKTKTPSALETGSSNLISVQEEGEVTTEAVTGSTSLLINKLPQLKSDVKRSITDSSKLKRKDISESVSGNLSYTNPIQTPVLHLFPSSISAGYSRSNYQLIYDLPTISEIDTLEFTDKYNGSLGFSPWKNFTVNPSYDLTTVREKRYYGNFKEEDIGIGAAEDHTLNIPKSLSQSVRGNVNISLLRWLKPTADYSNTISANYDITKSTYTNRTSVNTKSVTRTSNGKISWNFEPRNFYGMKNFKPLKSMGINSSYSIEDGDSYEKVPRDLFIQNAFWVRKPLKKEYTTYYSTSGVLNINAPRLRSLTMRDTQNYTARWNPFDWVAWFEGPLKPIQTISTTNILIKSQEERNDTGTITQVRTLTWPNADVAINDFEKMLFLGWILNGTRVNGKIYKKVVETIKTSENIERKQSSNLNTKCLKFLDLYFTYDTGKTEAFDIKPSTVTNQSQRIRDSLNTSRSRSAQLGFNMGVWRFSPGYSDSLTQAFNRLGNVTTDKMTKSGSLKIRGDLQKPKQFNLPFTSIGFNMKNRLILDTSLSYDMVRSPNLNVTKENTNTAKGNISADYELSTNLRVTFGFTYTQFRNIELKEDDYDEYAGNAGLTIQF